MIDDATATALRATAHRMADAARTETLRHFRRSGLRADNKAGGGGFDPVTVADRACERAMRAILAAERPQDAILGEEEAATAGSSGLTWVLDPIDGTRAFLAGAPTWGVLIGLRDAEGVRYGLIDQPWTGERFEGGFGMAELRRERGVTPLAARTGGGLADAILLSTFPEIGSPAERAAFERVSAQVQLTRYGLDCYGYALLALGQVDLVIEAGLHAYDIVAPIGVIAAAGGIVTDWQGGPVHDGGQVLAAAHPALHAEALALLNGG
jgi:histidinol phosphatase-like enzyme (inositol monophosphatase family)